MNEYKGHIESGNSITIYWNDRPYTMRDDHPNYQAIKDALLDARYDDLGDLLDIAKAVENFVEGDIEVKNEVVYYKGSRLHGVVVDKLMEMLRAGLKDSAPLTNFITRLQANPSANSVNELYSFMGYKSLPNTPEGKVLGYKGVQSDFWSVTGNADTIVVQGKTNDRHQILNEVGATIEVARRCVDDNKDNHCSFGLHIGSYDYANNWASEDGRLLLVEFDPADAVSVPTDCDFQKLRVSKYKVVQDITDTRIELNKPVYEANKPIRDNWEEVGEETLEEVDDYVDDSDSYEHWDYNETNDLPEGDEIDEYLRNYVDQKHSLGLYPKVSDIAGCRFCKDRKLTCQDIVDRFNGMHADGWHYHVADKGNGVSNSVIFDSPF